MDLNALYSDHQIALIRGASSRTRDGRRRHQVLADGIASRIHELQNGLGVTDCITLLPAVSQ